MTIWIQSCVNTIIAHKLGYVSKLIKNQKPAIFIIIINWKIKDHHSFAINKVQVLVEYINIITNLKQTKHFNSLLIIIIIYFSMNYQNDWYIVY